MFKKRLIERYIIAATLPYFGLSLLLLTAVLLAQQATRFAEVLGTARAPLDLAAEILLGLLPNILIFTLPMAMLTGTATGFSRMSGDSEIVAMRAAGVSTWRVASPMIFLGAIVSALTLYVGLELAPDAAYSLRQAALRAALYRLESPVEPRTFNTDMQGKVVYVRDGDQKSGEWGRVFIYWQEKNRPTTVVTARSGRIDSSGEQSELVLNDAVVTTLPEASEVSNGSQTETRKRAPTATEVTTERSSQLRIRDDKLNTGRNSLLERLRERELELDEMGWRELLSRAAESKDASRRRAAQLALHKRLALCTAPLILAFCGVGLGLRTRRGGRGLGVLLSLAVMIAYYLVSLAGEQLARVGTVPVPVGAWLATSLSMFAGITLILLNQRSLGLFGRLRKASGEESQSASDKQISHTRMRTLRMSVLGLLDRYMLRSLAWNFCVAYIALVGIFLIFTLFELLRFIAASGASTGVVVKYLLFLTPLATVALAPMSVLISVLVAYALAARRSEAVAWWACGQSVYRLSLPGIAFALAIGAGLWMVQENVLPEANRRQNTLRGQIRGGAAGSAGGVSRVTTPVGRQWLATTETTRLYSYEFDEREDALVKPVLYEFDTEGIHLRRILKGERGHWNMDEQGGSNDGISTLEIENGETLEFGLDSLSGRGRQTFSSEKIERVEPPEAFKPTLNKPAEMNLKQLSDYINALKRRGERTGIAQLMVALERKRADNFSPLVMALVGIPLALAFGRRSAVASLANAVVIGLAFWASTSGFQQLGAYGLLPPTLAAWAPPVIFAAAGIYLLFRART
ncbi:MAG TPA: LptF/LptG family permease [Pyrinomonadaceae bacterium]|jgi:LPS export ABC transporter permease LptF/LPS export ABC transporter permease LptG